MTSYRYGYVRVSTMEQDPAGQLDAMAAAGVDRGRVFVEYASGGRDDRPELGAVLGLLRPGDTLVVWRLDRLGRSMPHLIQTVSGRAARSSITAPRSASTWVIGSAASRMRTG